jgi:hypothetical protein
MTSDGTGSRTGVGGADTILISLTPTIAGTPFVEITYQGEKIAAGVMSLLETAALRLIFETQRALMHSYVNSPRVTKSLSASSSTSASPSAGKS